MMWEYKDVSTATIDQIELILIEVLSTNIAFVERSSFLLIYNLYSAISSIKILVLKLALFTTSVTAEQAATWEVGVYCIMYIYMYNVYLYSMI